MRRWLLFAWWAAFPPLRVRVLNRLLVERIVIGVERQPDYAFARFVEHFCEQLTPDERAYVDWRWPYIRHDLLASIPRLRAAALRQLQARG